MRPLRSATARRLAALALLLAGLVAAPGCRDRPADEGPAPAATPPSGPQRGGTAVVATIVDLEQVNELIDNGNDLTTELTYRMFLKLLEEQPDYTDHPPTFAPQLARSYSFSPDRRTLTFALRDDILWSDGQPVTAEDVRWTWEAQRHPDVGWLYGYVKEKIRDVEVVDPHTVRFHFAEVYAAQLLDANEGVILPKHAWSALPFAEWRQNGGWFRDHLVVNGPFTIAEWQPQQQVVLVPNPRYHEAGLPRLDRVVFRILPDKSNQLSQLRSGSVDFVEQVAPAEAKALADHPEIELQTYWPRQYDYICWNVRHPLFADAMVRRALTMGIDRAALIEALWLGFARPSVSPIISSVWAADRSLEPWPYDPAAAREILAERGWRDEDGDGIVERGGRPFRFELTTNTGAPTRADALVAIQAQLRRIGVDAQPRTIEGTTLTDRILRHEFEATYGAFAIDTSLDLTYVFHSDSIDGGYNFGSYADPEVDALIDRIRGEPDAMAAKPLFHRLQRLIHEDQPYTFLWEPQRINAHRSRLHDVQPNALLTYFNLEEWWVQ